MRAYPQLQVVYEVVGPLLDCAIGYKLLDMSKKDSFDQRMEFKIHR